jgi:purine nucleosidase
VRRFHTLPVIIDTDGGIDDALAILLALRLPVDLRAITTVAGNVGVEQATDNTLLTLEQAGRGDVLVAQGLARPLLGGASHARDVHGQDGLGNVRLSRPHLSPGGEHAVDAIVRCARSAPGELTLITIGPLSNLAVAALLEPHLPRLLRRVVAMGGAARAPGNVTPAAEFNVYADPEAARVVFGAAFALTMVGLDVTMKCLLTPEVLDALPDAGAAGFARAISRHMMDFHLRLGMPGFPLHDPLAVAVALDPSLVVTRRARVDVETEGALTRGHTVADLRPASPSGDVDVCLEVDTERFLTLFLEVLRHG